MLAGHRDGDVGFGQLLDGELRTPVARKIYSKGGGRLHHLRWSFAPSRQEAEGQDFDGGARRPGADGE
jgi:hypothetical protein